MKKTNHSPTLIIGIVLFIFSSIQGFLTWGDAPIKMTWRGVNMTAEPIANFVFAATGILFIVLGIFEKKMAIHIGCHVETAEGKILRQSNLNVIDICSAAFDLNSIDQGYPWLASIDPHGDTILNHKQLPNLIEELKSLEKKSKKLAKDIHALLSFIETIDDGELVRFLGD